MTDVMVVLDPKTKIEAQTALQEDASQLGLSPRGVLVMLKVLSDPLVADTYRSLTEKYKLVWVMNVLVHELSVSELDKMAEFFAYDIRPRKMQKTRRGRREIMTLRPAQTRRRQTMSRNKEGRRNTA